VFAILKTSLFAYNNFMKLSEKTKHKLSWVLLLVAVGSMIYLTINSGTDSKINNLTSKKNNEKSISGTTKKNNKKQNIIPRIRVTIDQLAFRSSPGVLYGNQKGVIGKGTILTLLGKEGSWYKVQTPGKRVGYVSSKKGYTERVN
jgi:hypothetical protein